MNLLNELVILNDLTLDCHSLSINRADVLRVYFWVQAVLNTALHPAALHLTQRPRVVEGDILQETAWS